MRSIATERWGFAEAELSKKIGFHSPKVLSYTILQSSLPSLDVQYDKRMTALHYAQVPGHAETAAVLREAAAPPPAPTFRKQLTIEETKAGAAASNLRAAGVQTFDAEWDDEGVYFYQAFNDAIADWALEHQRFGGPDFKPTRMTWIKPSFAWMLYRSGYGSKRNQNRLMKVKLPHDVVAELLSECQCKEGGMEGGGGDGGRRGRDGGGGDGGSGGGGGGGEGDDGDDTASADFEYSGSRGRIQWDPARDIMTVDGKGGKVSLGLQFRLCRSLRRYEEAERPLTFQWHSHIHTEQCTL